MKILQEIHLELITTASADVPLKGLDYYIRRPCRIRKNDFQRHSLNLTVIGKLKERWAHFKTYRKARNLQDDVQFLKPNLTKEEIARGVLQRAQYAMVSSLYEGFGYPVIEAMSCAVHL